MVNYCVNMDPVTAGPAGPSATPMLEALVYQIKSVDQNIRTQIINIYAPK